MHNVPREDRWKEIVRWYLSPEHCSRSDTGCPIVTLAPEIARAKLGVKKRIAGLMKQLTQRWAEFMPGAPRESGSATSSSFLVRWPAPW